MDIQNKTFGYKTQEHDGDVMGTIDLSGGVVDITDPCYDDDVWCRINALEVKPGLYKCRAWIDWDSGRVASCEIMLKGSDRCGLVIQEIGEIGVDAGLAGFFPHKKNYSRNEWIELCDSLGDENNAWLRDDGFFTSSGWGDGCYAVKAGYRKNEIEYLRIDF